MSPSMRLCAQLTLPLLGAFSLAVNAATGGRVVDVEGRPVAEATVTLTPTSGTAGPAAWTVFSDANGQFAFPEAAPAGTLSVRRLGYAQVEGAQVAPADPALLIVRPEANEAAVAPASAWLAHIADPEVREPLITNCVGCHQLAAPEARAYAKLVDDTAEDHSDSARLQTWEAIVQQMNVISDQLFSMAGEPVGPAVGAENRVYTGGEPGAQAHRLSVALTGRMQQLKGYEYGAPLAVTSHTLIREYATPEPNTIREAVTLADPNQLWVADANSNNVIRVNATTGETRTYTIPGPLLGPHTLVPSKDGQLWVGPFYPGAILRLDPQTGNWKKWPLPRVNGSPVGVHDLSFDPTGELSTDRHGRIWFTDIFNDSLGWLDPKTGRSGSYHVPPVPGRTGGEAIYGLVMSPDHRQLWYAQLGIGVFGGFDIESHRFLPPVVLPDRNAGPRRISMSPDGVLYVALFGSGQLAVYDTHAQRMIGILDLPDRASAPYATTWDPKRHVVWIATSNADVIYRFDPATQRFSVLPLPRQRGYLREISVDPHSGALITSYANLGNDKVRGPRMALMIDPGDAPAATAKTSVSDTRAVTGVAK